MVRIIVRGPENMAFSKDTVSSIEEAGMVFSRRERFESYSEYLVVNHGSHAPLNFGGKVKKAVVLNNPANIKLSVNKSLMYDHAIKAGIKNVPKTYGMPGGQGFMQAVDTLGLPIILKPNTGHGGEGCKVFTKASELIGTAWKGGKDYVAQQYINKNNEYRFNFINGELVNVSRKILPSEAAKHPGVFDGWLSLGQATNLHKRAHTMAKSIADAFPLPSLAVDLMRQDLGGDKVQYWFGEVNTGYGLGPMTAGRIADSLRSQWASGALDKYRVV